MALKDGSEISIQQDLYREDLSDEELLTLASGSTEPQGQMSAFDEIQGDCGRSWIYLTRAGQFIGEVWLGFEVNSPAVAYNASYLLSEDDNDPTGGLGASRQTQVMKVLWPRRRGGSTVSTRVFPQAGSTSSRSRQ